ncbi:hypothetical protein PCL_07437 [Purpureocillium lilacinum]|uniref:NADH:flavin oxidoreductase/NADH oxidase N-terminal domain-containing protein n=1 Tax=Purpureocillium lilacinum TaxID=33203 RepID=A0A2U3DS16_PURLI|nr:hypothetical protein PCL_07437 [Purpureocillium lilacinum]
MDLQVAQPITLPCGLTLSNRLLKSALAEAWCDEDHLPSLDLLQAYEAWADGGWGMIITGNVLVDMNHLSTPEDNALNTNIDSNMLLSRWRQWSKAISKGGTPGIVQVNHPGRQSISWAGHGGFFSKAVAPSAIRLDFGGGLLFGLVQRVMFGTPREMTEEDIANVVQRFAEIARISSAAGFSGVQIHAAHGYLLSQFLSARSNHRKDQYGGTAPNRARIVLEVIRAMREVVPSEFCIGIKLNSADHQTTGEFEDCLQQLKLIAYAKVDFLEISGGTYETPTMLVETVTNESVRTAAREAFFLDFAHAVRKLIPHVHLVVTRGFRTRRGMESAMREGGCDMVGIGRPAILNPALPSQLILNEEVRDDEAQLYARRIPSSWVATKLGLLAVTGSSEIIWYQEMMRKMIDGRSNGGAQTTLGKLSKWLMLE